MSVEQLAALGAPGVWLAFIAVLVLILFSGTKLSVYGDLIAVRTGLGGTWVGVVLMATVTSLPELFTGISAVVVVDQPDLAVGTALGSCIYNLIIIAILDFVYRSGNIYSEMRQGHSLSAGYGVILLGTAAGAILLQQQFTSISLGPIGPYTLVTPIIYALAMRSVFHFERREREAHAGEVVEAVETLSGGSGPLTMKQIYTRYAMHAAVIVVAAVALPLIGEALALTMGWRETFVGTIFLAMATSVPEIVISVQAVRIGAIDLAIGNVLGSNLFDLLILAILDVFYLDGPLLAAASHQHAFTAIAALTMTGVALVALSYRPKTKVFQLVSWVSLAIFTVGLLNALILYLLG